MEQLSVIVCTANRSIQLDQCIKAILKNDYKNYELIIVDQSNDDKSRRVVDKYRNDNVIIRYLHCPCKGTAYARNYGASHAEGEIIAFTDDDCIPHEDWAKNIMEFFTRNKDAVLLFGSVIPVPFDIDEGRIPGGKKADRVFIGRIGMIKQDGTSANMSMRKELSETLHGFDEVLTNKYFGAEDWDFAYRVLASGFPIHHSSDVCVDHDGFRTWPEAFRIHRRYEMGTAALFMKHARCGDMVSLWVWLRTLLFKLKLIILTAFAFKKKNILSKLIFIIKYQLLYLFWNCKGAILSFKYKIDIKTKKYIN